MPVSRFKTYSDEELAGLLRQGEEGAFEEIYHRYWPRLHSMAYKRVRNKEVTEELVQDVFTKLWINREKLVIHSSLSAYLLRAAKHSVLDYMRREMVRDTHRAYLQIMSLDADNSTEQSIYLDDLQLSLQASISQLPDKCRSVFQLSRQEEFSMKEIAVQLQISPKTVENHLGKALKHLRISLKDFLALLLIVFSTRL